MSAERVTQLIELTERLTALIAAEALAFEQHRPQDAAANIAETSRLANMYRHESAKVRQDPRLIEGAPRDQRLKLIQLRLRPDGIHRTRWLQAQFDLAALEGLGQQIPQNRLQRPEFIRHLEAQIQKTAVD